ncbi:cell division protein ZipA [Halomonas campisalis]|uniref:Cell division protein ZipA n=1 Tax=Billgrantia campisalis TaxID=74661 RepID=A0ABS9P9I4_9GAMM|nr:cell division protein ZipA [Halomonas campisalis]MCG6658420.1 cell division protein ZipA [Halomonas campisalis]MDR5863091.1 cell division protein ZipA [Halomonas campisalis]
MELREWLIILGLALVTLIVIDGIRRLKRQRRVPRLDQAGGEPGLEGGGSAAGVDAEADANWELPNGGARVVSPASYSQVQPKPKLQRQEHPGPSRVFAGWKQGARAASGAAGRASDTAPPGPAAPAPDAARKPAQRVPESSVPPKAQAVPESAPQRETGPERGDSVAASSPSGPGREAAQGEPGKAQSGAAEASSAARAPATTDEAPPVAEPNARAEGASSEKRATADTETTEKRGQTKAKTHAQAGADQPAPTEVRREPTLSALDDDAPPAAVADEPLVADPEDHDELHDDDERYRLVDLEGMGNSLKSGSRRMGQSVQRFGASVQQRMAKRREKKRQEKARRDQARAEKAARDAERRRLAQEQAAAEQAAREAERRRREAEAIAQADDDDPLFTPARSHRAQYAEPSHGDATPAYAEGADPVALSREDDVVRTHPTLEKALRHDVNAERARDTLSHAEEVIVISVISRDEAGFSGTALLDLMLACGLRYSREMGIFHRFETEDPDSELQFSMVNVLKPGTFPIEAMDDFTTPGITLLMPLPGPLDTAAAFEAMVETAMVIVRHLGGELKDENHSVMTAQTVEFARQRVQEFERRNRLNRYQVN